MADRVLLELDDGVATVTLTHPPLNIFDLAMRDDLIGALTAVADIDDVRAMVLAADGRHFSAGADLSEFGSASSIFEARRIRWDRDPWSLLWDLPVPTIAALHGVALGSGLEMALLCDLRIAGHDTRLGLPETKLGMLPAAGGTQSLTKVVGPSRSVPLIATADEITPAEALAQGAVTELADDPDERAVELARDLAGLDRTAVRAMKRCLRAALDLPLDDGLRRERHLALLASS